MPLNLLVIRIYLNIRKRRQREKWLEKYFEKTDFNPYNIISSAILRNSFSSNIVQLKKQQFPPGLLSNLRMALFPLLVIQQNLSRMNISVLL